MDKYAIFYPEKLLLYIRLVDIRKTQFDLKCKNYRTEVGKLPN